MLAVFEATPRYDGGGGLAAGTPRAGLRSRNDMVMRLTKTNEVMAPMPCRARVVKVRCVSCRRELGISSFARIVICLILKFPLRRIIVIV